ncbi:ATP-binding cassette domain-containing protein [Alicyclobacillus sp. SP_1]|uniref:ATP-binding cassette domain-containing protein n=1 Tax=Alicyclobacillus sp. SP_1 TaxID=2942475 RepID=UPI002157B002|nr:ATP-binding cassette domain-containing protein [Alicyclobacillus sp. SP_1]
MTTEPTSNQAIRVANLRKRYGDVEALRGIDLSVEWGELYGFLGPNGAGKSTAIQILTTLILPTEGSAQVGGADVVRHPEMVRFRIGVALQDTGVDPLLTGRELLTIQGRLFGLRKQESRNRATELLNQFNLQEAADRRVKTYSGGMRRRLDLALALVHRPSILFLDEPTTGLDPVNRIALWDLLRQVNEETGTTIFMTTQYLEEADALCQRIAIMDRGKIVAEDTPTGLKRRLQRDVIELDPEHPEEAAHIAETLRTAGFDAVADKDLIRVFSANGAHSIGGVLQHLESKSVGIAGLRVTQPSLDDVFLQLTTASVNEG